ncbi:hypothetical protein Tco_0353939, partial [Tanacetum coccineum]
MTNVALERGDVDMTEADTFEDTDEETYQGSSLNSNIEDQVQ